MARARVNTVDEAVSELRVFVAQHKDHCWMDARLELRVNRARRALAAYDANLRQEVRDVEFLRVA
jgi:hypothetical protein